MSKQLRATAAWRISIWTTLAFALGTALAFSLVYLVVAQGIRERGDTWLSGEAEVLAHVSADTPKDHLYKRVVGEVAELATQEVPDERNSRGERLNSVFFLAIGAGFDLGFAGCFFLWGFIAKCRASCPPPCAVQMSQCECSWRSSLGCRGR